MNPIVFVLNAGIAIYAAGLLYGIVSGRIFFVRWYYRSESVRKYWEVIISYILMIFGLIFIRHLLLLRI